MKMKLAATAIVAATMALSGCATSPTGRNQVLLYSESQLAQMGDQAFTSMKEELKVSSKRVQNSYVECVANAITAQVPASVFDGQWEVVVPYRSRKNVWSRSQSVAIQTNPAQHFQWPVPYR